MTNYESSEFLVDGSVAFDYDSLPYGEKLKIKALQGLDSLAASLNAISNVKAIEFQIQHLLDTTETFNAQMEAQTANFNAKLAVVNAQLEAKDAEIAQLKEQSNSTGSLQEQIVLLQQQIQDQTAARAEQQLEHQTAIQNLQAENAYLTERFNKLKGVLQNIDVLTDEVID